MLTLGRWCLEDRHTSATKSGLPVPGWSPARWLTGASAIDRCLPGPRETTAPAHGHTNLPADATQPPGQRRRRPCEPESPRRPWQRSPPGRSFRRRDGPGHPVPSCRPSPRAGPARAPVLPGERNMALHGWPSRAELSRVSKQVVTDVLDRLPAVPVQGAA